MEVDSLQHHNHLGKSGSARCPVKGMESVVATVSGYQGSERFNLIRLIDRTGASYVGNMTQSVTHVVCWRFEGRKYELAMKLRIKVVNHCWIEECVKKGRRVSEEPYTYHSGEEMGPLVLDILLGIDQTKARLKDKNDQTKARSKDKKAKRPLVNPELEDVDDGIWKDSVLLDEDLFPKKRQANYCPSRSIAKTIKRNSRKDCPSSSRHGLQKLSTSKIVELDDASTSKAAYSSRQEKKISTSPELWPKRRRLVKKQMSSKDWLINSDEEDECEEVKVLPVNKSHAVLVDSSEIERQQVTSDRHTSNMGSTLTGLENTYAHDTFQEIEHLDDDDIEELEHLNHENQNSCARAVPSSFATSEKLHEAANPDSTEQDSLPTASSELSCVICWTDFSPTRGVLPCGHRFCFSCIQNWADHMTSSRKPSTCPLCKASFICITKVEDAVSSDQKIYSQSMPNDSWKTNLYVLPDETHTHPTNQSAPACYKCLSREPEDLLLRCTFCIRRVHTYCLDPPLRPWTCEHCKDLQMLYLHNR